MNESINRTYGSALWGTLEDRWIKAKAEFVAAQAELKDAEEAMQREIRRRGDTPEELGSRVNIDGDKLTIIYRLNDGRVTLDSKRLRDEEPAIADRYSKQGGPYFTFQPKVKVAAAVCDDVADVA